MERQLSVKARFYIRAILDAELQPTTFPRLLLAHAAKQPDAPAAREKDLGIWQSWTWGAMRDEVEWLACADRKSVV